MSLIPALIGSNLMVQLHGVSVTRRSTCKGEFLQRPLSTVPNVVVCFVTLASLRGRSGFVPRVWTFQLPARRLLLGLSGLHCKCL